MRNFVIGCIVLFVMAGTAWGETKEAEKKASAEPKKLSVDLGGGVKMEMTRIPAGEFMMGSGESAEETDYAPCTLRVEALGLVNAEMGSTLVGSSKNRRRDGFAQSSTPRVRRFFRSTLRLRTMAS